MELPAGVPALGRCPTGGVAAVHPYTWLGGHGHEEAGRSPQPDPPDASVLPDDRLWTTTLIGSDSGGCFLPDPCPDVSARTLGRRRRCQERPERLDGGLQAQSRAAEAMSGGLGGLATSSVEKPTARFRAFRSIGHGHMEMMVKGLS